MFFGSISVDSIDLPTNGRRDGSNIKTTKRSPQLTYVNVSCIEK